MRFEDFKYLIAGIVKEIGWFIYAFVVTTVFMWLAVGAIWISAWVRTALGF